MEMRALRLSAWLQAVWLLVLACHGAPALAEPIPFQLIKDKIIVPVTINGQATFAMVDTAAGKSGIDATLAQELQLANARQVKLKGMNGGMVSASIASGVDVGIAGAATKLDVFVTDLGFGKHLNTEVRAVIGHDLLAQHVVAIDFDTLTIDLTPAAAFTAFPKTAPTPLKFNGKVWSIAAQISGFGSRDAIFDLGAEGAMIMAPSAIDRMRLTFGKKTSAAQLTSANQQISKVTMMSAQSIEIGPGEFERVPIALMPAGENFFKAVAGTAILSRFNLLIDLSRNRVWMTPNSRAALPFRRGVTGLIYGEDRVLSMVAPGSPAKAAGFRQGERIAALYDVAGAPILDSYEIDAGESVRVVLADGREKTIVAAEYY
jgi:hypothetical protein